MAIRSEGLADRGNDHRASLLLPLSALSRPPLQRKADASLHLQGFDEFMNVVLDDASEIYVKTGKPRRPLGESTVRFFGVMRVVCANAGASWTEDGP
jgi:hypothetical protein